MFLKHQISILEWFLKYHVTLKTEVMAAENFSFAIPAINYILKESYDAISRFAFSLEC